MIKIGAVRERYLNNNLNHLSYSINDKINQYEINLLVMKVSGDINDNLNKSQQIPRCFSSIEIPDKNEKKSALLDNANAKS